MTAAPERRARIATEVARVLEASPEVARLVRPQPGEPEQLDATVLRRGPSPLWLVPLEVPGVSGRARVSRLIGQHVPETDGDLERLVAFGIRWVFCLVPPNLVGDKHGASRYVAAATARFAERFVCVDIDDHDVPPDDATFERAVDSALSALRRGEDILVHCVGGCGRTGMFLSCVMVALGLSPDDAIRAFRRARRCGPETPEQVAYVFRFFERRARAAEDVPVRAWVSRNRDGSIRQLARGGLGTIALGRVQFASGGRRRVAVKLFRKPLIQNDAEALRICIRELREAGVRLPKMAVLRLEDGSWVQVSPLFGAARTGSKLHQPGTFYRELDGPDRRFATDQLVRVANAGYRPSVDLFLAFRPPRRGILPLDLDLILPETDAVVLGGEIIKRILQISADTGDRAELLALALGVAHRPIAGAIEDLVRGPGPYERLWKHL